MITEISKEVESKIEEYLERFRTYGARTGDVDKIECINALKEFGKYLNTSFTKFTFVDSPKMSIEYIKSKRDIDYSTIINGCNWGNMYAYWASYYSFIENELPVNKTGLIEMLENIIRNVPPFWINGSEVIISNFPKKLTFDNNKKLHCDDGKAIEYTDGFGIYSLHGIRVPEWLVKTPKSDISVERVLGIKNAEIRLAAIRHVGLHNFLSKLDYKVLDKKVMSNNKVEELTNIMKESLGTNYTLFQLNNPDIFKYSYELLLVRIEGRFCEFLKMVNPSTGEIHMEGVQPGIKTVNQALAWRMGLNVFGKVAFEA